MEIIKRKPRNGLHPAVPELQEQLRQGKISRREFLRYATLLGVSMGGAAALAACGQPAAAPTPVPQPQHPLPQPFHRRPCRQRPRLLRQPRRRLRRRARSRAAAS